MRNVVLYSTDAEATQKDIAAKKGRIRMRFGPHVIVAALRKETDPEGIDAATQTQPEDLDPKWVRMVRNWLEREPRDTTTPGIPWDTEGYLPPADKDDDQPPEALTTGNLSNNFMQGSIAVGVVIVEGEASDVSWKQDQVDKVQRKVDSALEWYQESNVEAELAFTVDFQEVLLDLPNDIWSSEQDTGARASSAPALAAMNGTLYLAARDKDSNKIEIWSSPDGLTWSRLTTLSNKTEKNPGMTAVQGTNSDALYLAFKDKSSGDIVTMKSTNGTSWTELATLNENTSEGPGMTALNGTVYLSIINSNEILVSSYNGTAWSDFRGTGLNSSTTANMAAWNNRIYLAYKNKGDNKILVSESGNGTSWSAAFDTGYRTSKTPGIGTISGGLVIIWADKDDNKLYFGSSRSPTSHWAEKNKVGGKSSSGLAAVGIGREFYAAYSGDDTKKVFCINCSSISPGNNYNTYENYWKLPALDKLGGYTSSKAYAKALADQYGTDWAYIGYFTKYETVWFAYTSRGQVEVVMQYSNDGWGSDNLDKVFAHESGHIFGANDEYSSSNCTCTQTGGYEAVPNKNCDCGSCSGCVAKRMSCLMDGNVWQICSWSRGQIGWNYWGDSEQQKNETDEQPAVAVVNSSVYMAWKDKESNKIMSAVSANGTDWQNGPTLDEKTDAGPGLCNHNGTLYLAYRDKSNSKIHVSHLNSAGSAWSTPVNTGQQSGSVPAIQSWNGQLYIVFKKKGDNDYKLMKSGDNGATWSDSEKIGKTGSSGPSLTTFDDGNLLVMAWRNNGDDKIKVATTSNGKDWSDSYLPGDKCTNIPVIAASGEFLYLAYRAKDEGSKLFTMASPDGETWDNPYKQYFTSSTGPGFAADAGGNQYLAWKGDGNPNLNTCPRTPGPSLVKVEVEEAVEVGV